MAYRLPLGTGLSGTFTGQAKYLRGPYAVDGNSADTRQAAMMQGYLFSPDGDAEFTHTLQASIQSCNPQKPTYAGITNGLVAQLGALSFETVSNAVPGSTSNGAYFDRGAGFQGTILGCTTGITQRVLPGLDLFNFDLNFDSLQMFDLNTQLFSSGPAGLPGPVFENGDYANPGNATYSWCLAPMREGQPAPSVCP